MLARGGSRASGRETNARGNPSKHAEAGAGGSDKTRAWKRTAQLHRHALLDAEEAAKAVERVPSELEVLLLLVKVVEDEDEARDHGGPVEGHVELEEDDHDLLRWVEVHALPVWARIDIVSRKRPLVGRHRDRCTHQHAHTPP